MPGRDRLLRERDHAHAAAEQQAAHDERVAPLAAGRCDEVTAIAQRATRGAGRLRRCRSGSRP